MRTISNFDYSTVAKRVAERGHVLDGVNLMTSLYVPPKPPPSYPDKVLIKGLKPTTTEDGLFNFIEAKSEYIPVPGSMVFHAEEEGVVMITLNTEPGKELTSKNTLQYPNSTWFYLNSVDTFKTTNIEFK